MTAPTYVYGLIHADAPIPDGLSGLGPAGRVTAIAHGEVAALVSDVPADRPLGTRDDLIAHESVVDSVARTTTVLPMRFPAVVEEHAVVDELLEPNHDRFVEALHELDEHVQYTLRARYERDVALREILEERGDIRDLRQRMQELPEDASYQIRIQLGELVVKELERRREDDAAGLVDRLAPLAARQVAQQPSAPDEVLHVAFLVGRGRQEEFENAVEQLGADVHERVRMRLLGPIAPYDFVSEG